MVGSAGDPCLARVAEGRRLSKHSVLIPPDPDLLRVWKAVNVERRRCRIYAHLQKNRRGNADAKTETKKLFFSSSFFPPSAHLDIHTFSGIGRDGEGHWLHQM